MDDEAVFTEDMLIEMARTGNETNFISDEFDILIKEAYERFREWLPGHLEWLKDTTNAKQ